MSLLKVVEMCITRSFIQFISRVSHDNKYILPSVIACYVYILVNISHGIYWHCDDIKPEDMATKEIEKYTSEFHDWQSKNNSFVRIHYWIENDLSSVC